MKKGFTLIELLVTITILAFLATVAFGQYRMSQLKARDAQRKADLDNLARALEMYYNDHQAYPFSDASGLIEVSRDGGTVSLDWGGEFSTDEVIYMKVLPQDPLQDGAHLDYCYQGDGSFYRLFAELENERDSDLDSNQEPPVDYQCVGETEYSYGISSANVSVSGT